MASHRHPNVHPCLAPSRCRACCRVNGVGKRPPGRMCSAVQMRGSEGRGGGAGEWTGDPSSWGVSPGSTPHLRAVAARLAGRQVLAEPRAQVCGTESSAGGAAGLELEGRCTAVLCRGRQAGRQPHLQCGVTGLCPRAYGCSAGHMALYPGHGAKHFEVISGKWLAADIYHPPLLRK